MSLSLRQQKASSLWQQKLARILVEDLHRARTVATVYEVVPSADLRFALVKISAVGSGANQIVDSLNSRRAEISAQLATQLASKFSPKLEFVLDRTESTAFALEQTIKSLD